MSLSWKPWKHFPLLLNITAFILYLCILFSTNSNNNGLYSLSKASSHHIHMYSGKLICLGVMTGLSWILLLCFILFICYISFSEKLMYIMHKRICWTIWHTKYILGRIKTDLSCRIYSTNNKQTLKRWRIWWPVYTYIKVQSSWRWQLYGFNVNLLAIIYLKLIRKSVIFSNIHFGVRSLYLIFEKWYGGFIHQC